MSISTCRRHWSPHAVLLLVATLAAWCSAWCVADKVASPTHGDRAAGVVGKSIEFSGLTMGSTYAVKCWSADEASAVDRVAVQRAVDQVLAGVNRQMSTYDPESEISRFKRAPANKWFAVSPATREVVDAAIELHARTNGAFDVTVGPVLRLWHFGAGANSRGARLAAPSEASLTAARGLVGMERLETRREPPAIRKTKAGVELDLSAIAPGFGVDAVSDRLFQLGYENSLVEIGGEVRARGRRGDNTPWRIGIEGLAEHGPTISETVALSELSLATSGDYRNYRRVDGKLVAHIVDPKTGHPVPYRGASVTVLAPTCMEADGLATALIVMGQQRAMAWCDKQGVAALIQTRAKNGTAVRRATRRFEALTGASSATTPAAGSK